jgi:peptide maturation system protein (TIGR04066 family)
MKNLLIYPFCKEFSEFARCAGILEGYDGVILVAPKGFGLEGEDACVCDGGERLDIRISSDYAAGIEQADAAFFGHTILNISAPNYRQKIRTALAFNKKVFITKELKEFLGDADDWEQTEVLEYTKGIFENNLTLNLFLIPVPVILVIGIGDYCNKFSIQLKLKDYLSDQGYHIMNWGSKSFSKLFGIEPLPQFLFDPMDNGMKIKQLNAYIYGRIKEENPEAVIIGVPGGIMQTNPFKFDEFGELAFIISNAVKADITVLSVYKQEYTHEFIEQLINICKYRYNFYVNYINIANTDFYISPDDKEYHFTTVPSKHIIDNIINNFKYDDVFLFNALNDASMREASAKIQKELENNI